MDSAAQPHRHDGLCSESRPTPRSSIAHSLPGSSPAVAAAPAAVSFHRHSPPSLQMESLSSSSSSILPSLSPVSPPNDPSPGRPTSLSFSPKKRDACCAVGGNGAVAPSQKESKLWGGRFEETVSDAVEKFTESISYDKALYKHDIMGSRAHATMLAHQVTPSRVSDRSGIYEFYFGIISVDLQVDALL